MSERLASEGLTCTDCGTHIEETSKVFTCEECGEPICEDCLTEAGKEEMRECGQTLIRVIRAAVERGDSELIEHLGNAWGECIDKRKEPDGCPDCGVAPRSIHLPGCDVERCPYCGGQLLSCCCEDSADGVPADDLLPWTGEWPGVAECLEFGWYSRRNPDGPDYIPCSPDHPDAGPDLNRLHDTTQAIWDRAAKRFVRKVVGSE